MKLVFLKISFEKSFQGMLFLSDYLKKNETFLRKMASNEIFCDEFSNEVFFLAKEDDPLIGTMYDATAEIWGGKNIMREDIEVGNEYTWKQIQDLNYTIHTGYGGTSGYTCMSHSSGLGFCFSSNDQNPLDVVPTDEKYTLVHMKGVK